MSLPVSNLQPVVGGPTTRLQKAAAIVAAGSLTGRSFQAGKYTVSLADEPVLAATARNQLSLSLNLRVTLTASGIDVTPPDLNPVTIVNPPMATRDAAGVPTVNPYAALRETIIDLLKKYA